MKVLIETATRTLLVLNPPMRDGKPILPESVKCELVELSDADAALIGQSNARYSVDKAGRLVVTPVAVVPVVDPNTKLMAAITAATTITQLKSAILGGLSATITSVAIQQL